MIKHVGLFQRKAYKSVFISCMLYLMATKTGTTPTVSEILD